MSDTTANAGTAVRWECPACETWSRTCYRCSACGKDFATASKRVRVIRAWEWEQRRRALAAQAREKAHTRPE